MLNLELEIFQEGSANETAGRREDIRKATLCKQNTVHASLNASLYTLSFSSGSISGAKK